MNPIPEKLINFKAYLGSDDLVGLVDAQLPSFDSLTDTVKGAGLAGEIETPVLGHFGPMKLVLKFRTMTTKFADLFKQESKEINLRGSLQVYDSAKGIYAPQPVRVMVKAIPTKTSPGKFEVGAQTDTQHEFECTYVKMWVNGTEVAEVDKFNFICKIGNVDVLSSVRSHLGF